MSRHTITSMNCKTLLEHLRNGAKLHTILWYGTWHRLSFPTGETLYVQRSNIDALLKAGTLHSIAFSGGEYEYYLPTSKEQTT